MCTKFTLLKDVSRFCTAFLQRIQTTNNISKLTALLKLIAADGLQYTCICPTSVLP